MLQAFVSLAANGALLSVLWYGGTLVLANAISVGDLASFALYSVFVGGGFMGMASSYADLMRAAAASDRVFALVEPPQRQEGVPVLLRPHTCVGEIELAAVTFAYPSRPEVASHLRCTPARTHGHTLIRAKAAPGRPVRTLQGHLACYNVVRHVVIFLSRRGNTGRASACMPRDTTRHARCVPNGRRSKCSEVCRCACARASRWRSLGQAARANRP